LPVVTIKLVVTSPAGRPRDGFAPNTAGSAGSPVALNVAVQLGLLALKFH
jgi:hypothetical protein